MSLEILFKNLIIQKLMNPPLKPFVAHEHEPRINSRKKRTRILWLILLLLLVASGCDKKKSILTQNEQAPELAVLNLKGDAVKLAHFRGKVVVLNFWMQGCNACAAEMSEINAVYQKYELRDLTVLGINMGDSKDFVEDYQKELNISFPLLLDTLLITTEKYKVSVVPTTYILDKEGRFLERIVGETTKTILEEKILKLL